MAGESETASSNTISKLKSIHIDLEALSIETFADNGLVARFTFSPEGVFQQLIMNGVLETAATRRLLLATPWDAPPDAPPETADERETPAAIRDEASTRVPLDVASSREKQPALVLPGRLQTRPMEGRPDGRGRPTAWARFLAHIEGSDSAMLLSATFHNRTREIALSLADGDPITAQGYLHQSRDSERLATFSVFHLIRYPGKPSSKAEPSG